MEMIETCSQMLGLQRLGLTNAARGVSVERTAESVFVTGVM